MVLRLAMLFCLLAPATAGAQCEVTGIASMQRLRVRTPPAERMRTFSVTDLPIAVRPGPSGQFRDVRVLAPVAFDARSDGAVPWTIPRAGAFADGALWLTPLVEIEEVMERDGELVVRAQVDEGVWISRVHLPCNAVSLGHAEGAVTGPTWGTPSGPRWQLASDTAWLLSGPGEGASVRLDAPEDLPTPLVEIERRGEWVRVSGRFTSGAALRAWARRTDLRVAPPEHPESRAFVRSVPMPPTGRCPRRAQSRREYVGPAQIAAGTSVRTRPDGAPWATITEPALLTIAWRTGSPWARIVHVPGLRHDARCPEMLDRAWVPREAITLRGQNGADTSVLIGE